MAKKISRTYRRQRIKDGKDQAFVELGKKRHYLGTYGTKESKERYHRLLADFEANGQVLAPLGKMPDLTVAELGAAFWRHAQTFYRDADGKPTSTLGGIKLVLRPLVKIYGSSLARNFGPVALKVVRQEMVKLGWCRTSINSQVGVVRRVFRWGVETELIPPSVWHGLQALPPLRRGRSTAGEVDAVKPVPPDRVWKIQPHVARQVFGMIQLQLLTGMRPGEVVLMRPMDLDTSQEVWTYSPTHHKMAHFGHERKVFLGPKAQAIIRPFLLRPEDAFLFSPIEAERDRFRVRAAKRQTPLSCGSRAGENLKKNPRRRPASRYTASSYARAIQAGCDKAYPPPRHLARQMTQGGRGKNDRRFETDQEWYARLGKDGVAELRAWRKEHRWAPNRLRHNAATELRKNFGLDTAQVVLGHRFGSNVTALYAENDIARAAQAIREVG